MKPLTRRKLLLTSGAAALAASTYSQAEARTALVSTAGPFSVRSGQGRPGGQWPVHGENAFSTKVSGADVSKRYAVIEVHTPPGLGPELHIHPGQNELFFVLAGSIGVQCGSHREILKVGDSFMAPADVPHAFVALGKEPAHMLFLFDPAGEMEAFFAEYAPMLDANREPDPRKLAEIYLKHGLKVVGPPLTALSFSA